MRYQHTLSITILASFEGVFESVVTNSNSESETNPILVVDTVVVVLLLIKSIVIVASFYN